MYQSGNLREFWSTFYQNSSQFLAKLAPPIAREGAFFSVFRDLHDFRIFSWKLSKFCWKFCYFHIKSPEFSENLNKITKFWLFLKYFQEKSVNSCRFWKMLKNAPFLITIGVDTAENEPRKEWWVVARTGVSILRAQLSTLSRCWCSSTVGVGTADPMLLHSNDLPEMQNQNESPGRLRSGFSCWGEVPMKLSYHA